MTEQEFIYSKLKYLTESVDVLLSAVEQQHIIIDDLVKIIGQMQSPEYAKKQADTVRAADMAEKLLFMREMMNKKEI